MNTRELWPAELDATLERLWLQVDPHLSTRAIASAMDTSKNAIIGRAHRLHLPCRPSPIRHGNCGLGTKPAPVRYHRADMAALPSLEAAQNEAPEPAVPEPPAAVPEAVNEEPALDVGAAASTFYKPLKARECSFPLWPHGARPNGLFCRAPAPEGKTYCEKHQALCWTARPLRGVFIPGGAL